jgi:hypothetical protein
MQIALKKKGFMGFGSAEMDTKKIRLSELSQKCIVEKKIRIADLDFTMKFRVRQAIRGQEMEQIPVIKHHID